MQTDEGVVFPPVFRDFTLYVRAALWRGDRERGESPQPHCPQPDGRTHALSHSMTIATVFVARVRGARVSLGVPALSPLSWTWSCGLREQGGPLQDDHEVPQRVRREREPQLTARLLVQACRVRARVGAGVRVRVRVRV